MTKIDSIKILKELGIRDNRYSLDGDISNVASMVLYKNHAYWEIINIDDKGNQIKDKSFKRVEDAYDYICQYFIKDVELKNKYIKLKSTLRNNEKDEDNDVIFL